MSNVKAFKNSIPPGEPNQELVGRLKELVVEAESGTLRALAFCGVRTGLPGFTEWVNDPGDWDNLCMGILTLHHRMGKSAYEGED